MRRDTLIQPLPRSENATLKNHPWTPDQANGTYRNPVLWADYSDPDVIRVGEDFYLTSSSFNCVPGLPLLHSNDLVNWTLIGHALNELPHPSYNEVRHGCGVWAPTIRYHANKFWIFFSMPDEGIYVTVATNPAAEWSKPHLLHAGRGLIDPCPFWDDDGRAYLAHAYAESRCGIRHILRIRPMTPDGSALLGEGQVVFHNPARQPTIEGPKLYKRNGYYYIFAPAGGVQDGWQAVLRSRNILGPYEDRILLAQGDSEVNGPHQGAWVETAAGEHWFMHFQDRGPYGRVVHLQPMKWENDWPVMAAKRDRNGIGEPVLSWQKPHTERPAVMAVPAISDEFDAPRLASQWQWPANIRSDWYSLAARPGWLRLFAASLPKNAVNLWSAPNLLLQKFPAPEFTATASIDISDLAIGETAGIIVTGSDCSYAGLQRTDTGVQIIHAVCKAAPNGGRENVESTEHSGSNRIQLRVHVEREARCTFSFSNDGNHFVTLGRTFIARPGKWIGAKIGLLCIAGAKANPHGNGSKSGHADFDWFRV